MASLETIIQKLTAKAELIRGLEQNAKKALYENNDNKGHQQFLTEKALVLLHLPESIVEHTASLDVKIAQKIKSQLGSFSFSAGKALDLNSVFYMSALLYPENYTEGDKNDLENFIVKLESFC